LFFPFAPLGSGLAAPSSAFSFLKLLDSGSPDLEVSRAPFGWTNSFYVKVSGLPLAVSSKVITAGDSFEKTSTALDSDSKFNSYWFIFSPDGSMTGFDQFNFSSHPLFA
jgi:Archaea-specific editing domain of threonyl-tRNA synthetase.